MAVNFNFLTESAPVTHFTDKDFEMFLATIQKALNENKDGEKLVWINEETGHAGLI